MNEKLARLSFWVADSPSLGSGQGKRYATIISDILQITVEELDALGRAIAKSEAMV